jgi:hypothetical protein
LGTLAAEAGYRVRYTLASKLVNELVEAADDKLAVMVTPVLGPDAFVHSRHIRSPVRM